MMGNITEISTEDYVRWISWVYKIMADLGTADCDRRLATNWTPKERAHMRELLDSNLALVHACTLYIAECFLLRRGYSDDKYAELHNHYLRLIPYPKLLTELEVCVWG